MANEIIFLNGTTHYFYSIDYQYQTSSADNSNHWYWGESRIYLSNKYTRYEQYQLTQPNNVRRNLATQTNTTTVTTITTTTNTTEASSNSTSSSSSKEKEEKGTVYFYFWIVSQIGGVLAIGQMLLGFLVGYYAQRVYKYEAVNRFNMYSGDRGRNLGSGLDRIIPKNPKFKKLNDHAKNEFDPLVRPQDPVKFDKSLSSSDGLKNSKANDSTKKSAGGAKFDMNNSFSGLVNPSSIVVNNGSSPQLFQYGQVSRSLNTSTKFRTEMERKQKSKTYTT